jgi:hypothetical protein
MWFQSLGTQGPPGTIPTNLTSALLAYTPVGDVVTGVSNVQQMLQWTENNLIDWLDPIVNQAAANNTILRYNSATGKMVAVTANKALSDSVPGVDADSFLLWNPATRTYQVAQLDDYLTDNIAESLPEAFAEAFPCSDGQILSCTNGAWGATNFNTAMSDGIPGTNLYDMPIWNPGTQSYQVVPASTVVGNVFPAAFAAAYPCSNATSGNILSCVNGTWGSRPFLTAMNSGFPGTANNNVPIYRNGTWTQDSAGNIVAAGLDTALPDAMASVYPCADGEVLGCTGGVWGPTNLNYSDLGETNGSIGTNGQVIGNVNGVLTPLSFSQLFTNGFGACTAGQVLGCDGGVPGWSSLALTDLSDAPAVTPAKGVFTSDATGDTTWLQGNPGETLQLDSTGTPTYCKQGFAATYNGGAGVVAVNAAFLSYTTPVGSVTRDDFGGAMSAAGVFTAPVAGLYRIASRVLTQMRAQSGAATASFNMNTSFITTVVGTNIRIYQDLKSIRVGDSWVQADFVMAGEQYAYLAANATISIQHSLLVFNALEPFNLSYLGGVQGGPLFQVELVRCTA